MKSKFKISLVFLLFVLVQACSKDEPAPIEPDNTTANDFGIFYSAYQPGQVYTSDTLYTRFKIFNYGSSVVEAGDTLFAGVKVNNVVYNLDLLIGSPSALILDQPLPVGQSFEHNSGYLLRTSSLAYFGKDTVDLILLVYGQNASKTDLSFPDDPTPKNNSATLRLTKNNHFIVE